MTIKAATRHKTANQEARPAARRLSRSSGQMFIISSIFVIAGLVIIFSTLSTPNISEEVRFRETQALDKTARNLAGEYKFAIGVASVQASPNTSAMEYLNNLSSFLRGEMDVEVFYAVIFVNGTTQNYTAAAGNYLDRSINVTLDATGSTPSTASAFLTDKNSTSFFFNTSTSGIVFVNLSYSGTKESLAVNVSSRNFMIGLFDLTVKDAGSYIRIKDTYTRTW